MPDHGAPSMFERHLQTAIQLLIVAVLSWSGVELVNLGRTVAVLEERQIHQGRALDELSRDLREFSGLYQRKSDADRELTAIKGNLSNLTGRVRQLEESLP